MIRAAVFACLLFAAPCVGSAAEGGLLKGFAKTAEFAEQERWSRLPSGVRVCVNAPLPLAGDNRLLVIYATPNGNTAEQTLGCAAADGRDWHFDIQHALAQVRRLREMSLGENLILAVVQAPQLSWPAFRTAEKESGAIITGLVDSLARETEAKRIVLTGHSGGGSFTFGCLDAWDAIPKSIERIVFLDSNYAYADDKQHGDKLLAWLRGERSRRLVVIAYDDREITLSGKKVVSPTGGTWRASQRMLDRFTKDVELPEVKNGPFLHRRGLNGQIEFFLHPNPENKILHTALVGEMNGLVHALTLGSGPENRWGTFGGPRAYGKWVQQNAPTDYTLARARDSDVRLQLPARAAAAPTGSAFAEQIESLPREEREATILKEISSGNVPDFLRVLTAVDVAAVDDRGERHTATYFAMPDYLAVGTDDDFFRLPMSPITAQKFAASAGASLITTKISDDLWQAANLKLEPKPLTKDRDAAATFFQHHQIIEQQRKGQPHSRLIAGIKKDVVLTNRLQEKPGRVAIYGWHYASGRPIQPLYVGHIDWYVDYSHGIRLVAQRLIVDGKETTVSEVLADPVFHVLLSNEGPITAGYETK